MTLAVVIAERPALVYVAESAIHGLGLFAQIAIACGTRIGFYAGQETSEDGAHVLWVQDQPGGPWLGYDGSNEMRFVNHSREPNCYLDGRELYADRDIDRDEELTIDYGEWFDPRES